MPSLNLFGVRGRTSEREPRISPTNTSYTPTFLHVPSLLLNTEVMSTANLLNTQFDDSEEEDDNFNPQPADLSDAEDAGGDHDDDAEDQIRGEAARQKSERKGSDDEDAANKEEDDDEDEEDEGEEPAPRAGDDEEEDEEEDEEDEEITVCTEEDYESSLWSTKGTDAKLGTSSKAQTRTS